MEDSSLINILMEIINKRMNLWITLMKSEVPVTLLKPL